MPTSQTPPSLNLTEVSSKVDIAKPLTASTAGSRTPKSPRSPKSIPGSPFLQDFLEHASSWASRGPTGAKSDSTVEEGISRKAVGVQESSLPATITVVPQYPPSPAQSSTSHGRDTSEPFFSHPMASRSCHRLQFPDRNGAEVSENGGQNARTSSKDRAFYSTKSRAPASDLMKDIGTDGTVADQSRERTLLDSPFQALPDSGLNDISAAKKNKARFGGFLSRTRSIRSDEALGVRPSLPTRLNLDTRPILEDPQYAEALKTAPLRSDHRERAFREAIGSSHRNRSADRPPVLTQEPLNVPLRKDRLGSSPSSSASFRDGAGSQLLSNIHQTGRGVGDRLGKAGKGFLGKMIRSGSSNERELVTDDNYQCTVINLPLVRQTRQTRIAKRLELSKDKTEFWMPALPWRCIDYLNMNGCEEEGLYRIPGSGKDVKHWQRRFDTEYDINLFDEPDLYDINTIGSMFKSWLRELPDEIFPRTVQQKIADRCAGSTQTPQMLKDELSKLPPFNYYLLFAITCHLSLLHSFADKNKMDYRNLCICFQPCLRIDAFCFQFLVQDWKSCWQGCRTEKDYLEEEYRYEREGSIINHNHKGSDSYSLEDWAVSSTGSSQHLPAAQPLKQPIQACQHTIRPPNGSRSDSRNNGDHHSSSSGAAHSQFEDLSRVTPRNSHLPIMGPPLSPINIVSGS